MKSNLVLYTSYVTKENISEAVSRGLLPIFILRNIRNSEVCGKWSGSAIHFYSLAPSDDLYQRWRDGKIGLEDYKKNYAIEVSNVKFQDIIERLGYLCEICNASGAVLMGYGESYENSHRSTLAEILNASGLLEGKVEEIKL